MLTQSGLTAFVPGAIGDGNVTSQGWHTGTAGPGAWLQVDLGSARDITGVGIYAGSAGYAGTYNVQYSDNAASWSQAGSIAPSAGGWNAAGWSSVGAHRFWRLYLANTPGPGPWLTELQLQENTPWTNYIFFDGRRVARLDGNGVAYYFSDHLKTADVITDAAGNIKSESDYYPWGGELSFIANDSNHYKFTGKERDAETGLDHFGARYYSNGLGRWISADWSSTPIPVPYADFGDPQTLNLYAYVRNIPTSSADSDGHCFPVCSLIGPLINWLISEVGVKDPPHPILNAVGSALSGNPNFDANHPSVHDGANIQRNASKLAVGIAFVTAMPSPEGDGSTGVRTDSVEEGTALRGPVTAGAGTRLPQDVNVNPSPPPANAGNGTVGPSPTQNAVAQADAVAARAAGHTDIRMNQQQVNANGERVGINRPDLQSTDTNGVRHYTEYDRSSTNAAAHAQRTQANDSNGVTHTKIGQ